MTLWQISVDGMSHFTKKPVLVHELPSDAWFGLNSLCTKYISLRSVIGKINVWELLKIPNTDLFGSREKLFKLLSCVMSFFKVFREVLPVQRLNNL